MPLIEQGTRLMNHHELAQALAALTEKEVEAIVGAASNLRTAEQALAALAPKAKARKKRGPNKPKEASAAPVATPEAPPAAPAKRRGRPPLPKPAAFSSALDKLKAVKVGDVKVRRPSISTEDGE